MTIEKIKTQLAQLAGTDDVPEVYADVAATWINTLLRTLEEWSAMSDHVTVSSRYTNEPIR